MKRLLSCLFGAMATIALSAQDVIPYFPQRGDLNGETVDESTFLPSLGEYTLEMEVSKDQPVGLSFAQLSYVPTKDCTLRVCLCDSLLYVFEDNVYAATLTPTTEYTLEGENLIPNPSFEETEETLSDGRWKPTEWDTWNGGMATWGGAIGKTNVRENSKYRSDGTKSLIMHSESRYLTVQLQALEPSTTYELSYDYWTSEGSGNGGITYDIYLGSERLLSDVLSLQGHTTLQDDISQCSYRQWITTPDTLPANLWLTLYRAEDRVDWLDNFVLRKVQTTHKGLSGATNTSYLPYTAYAPEALELPSDTYMDMTSLMENPSFDDATLSDGAPEGWTLDVEESPQSKISVTAKGNAIAGDQNHWQLWQASGGLNGSACQQLSDLPIGRYQLSAAIYSQFSGNVWLMCGDGLTAFESGEAQQYSVVGTCADGTLCVGVKMQVTGGATIDMDSFTLYYQGMDGDGYRDLIDQAMDAAREDTLQMSLSSYPSFNNIEDYRTAMLSAENLSADADVPALLAVCNALIQVRSQWQAIVNAYLPLLAACDTLSAALSASAYPNSASMQEAIDSAMALFNDPLDRRDEISSMTTELQRLTTHVQQFAALGTLIDDVAAELQQAQYPGTEALAQALAQAQAVYDAPQDADLDATMLLLKQAQEQYYLSQYPIQPQQTQVSCVDLSLNGSEKYTLRVDGQPFYPTNVQVRLDKLYGYQGWNDAALEAVVKQAASDHFNTISVPLFWREVEPEKDCFDWTLLDKYLGWCKKYGLKMELLWFSWSSGGRVQYLWNVNGRQELRTPDYVCSMEGTSDYNMLRTEWEYSLDWRDTALMERDRYVLRRVMDHVALWDANNGNPHTVIGVQLGNEARAHGNNTATASEIIEYYHHVGRGVKESLYSTWTRLNCVSYETSGRTTANETKRSNGGTNIDFVGIDIYGTNASKVKGNMDGQLGTNGSNFRMIMEIDASDSSTPIYQMAALAGDKAFDYYNFCVVDGNALYTNSGTTLVERSHIDLVRHRNAILNMANQDVALRSHGNSLYVYNYAGDNTTEKGLANIQFKPASSQSQAIAIKRGTAQYVLLTTEGGTFTLPSSLGLNKAETGYYDQNNEWVGTDDVDFNGTTLTLPEATCVLLTYSEAPTSIAGIEAATAAVDGKIYDLTGRCVPKAEKGIFIVDGKKVIVN